MENTPENIIQLSNQSCIPPKISERNSHGLLCREDILYIYNEDGTINWRKMIKPEFLVPHKQVLERIGKPIPDTIEGLADKELLILLGGIKELAAIRGFSSCEYQVVSPSNDYVIAICRMTWIPNYETQDRAITSSGIGDASLNNTSGFGKLYLGPFAENRAFVRCVRQFLRINIVSQEEISEMAVEASEDMTTKLLKETAEKFGVTFEQIKAKLIVECGEDSEAIGICRDFKGFGDIPKFTQLELVARIKRKAEQAGLK